MPRFLVSGRDEAVADFVADHIPEYRASHTPFSTVGLCDAAGQIVGGCIFENYNHINVEAHIAVAGPVPRFFIRECFHYPFVQLGCRRITVLVREKNEAGRKFVHRLGFVQEGRIREALPNYENLIVYGILKHHCRWLPGATHGAESSERIGRRELERLSTVRT